MENTMSYSDRLAKVIEILSLDPKQIAQEIGFGRSAVYALLSGKPGKPSDRFLKEMAEKYGVSESWLMSGDGPIFLPGRFPIAGFENATTEELRKIEMVNFLTHNLTLPPSCQTELLEVAEKLVALRDGSKTVPTDVWGEAESSLPGKESAENGQSNVPAKTIRLRKQYAKIKAQEVIQRQSVAARATIIMRESKKLPSSLTNFVLSKHDNLLEISNLRMVDCFIAEIHRQTEDDVFLVDAIGQFEFTGTLKKENGTSEREFGVIAELSYCVHDQKRRFKSACILRESVDFKYHEIFYAIDTELGAARQKNVSVSGPIKTKEATQRVPMHAVISDEILIFPGDVAQMEEFMETSELINSDEMDFYGETFDALYAMRGPVEAQAVAT